ncbi:hypothetical protein P280DRAFT_3153 [Massarina eburnea CBS 473.64]|uniref:Uncharacterized protein n=1 Tax=Massarina eburnea CBS 473.64 TaxID=1395130 RepID=A0A6A6SF48_9PLEO|nr:hypothetical protein P280DRAFT_3153 [Massarina eburnea CBS 473.64]
MMHKEAIMQMQGTQLYPPSSIPIHHTRRTRKAFPHNCIRSIQNMHHMIQKQDDPDLSYCRHHSRTNPPHPPPTMHKKRNNSSFYKNNTSNPFLAPKEKKTPNLFLFYLHRSLHLITQLLNA